MNSVGNNTHFASSSWVSAILPWCKSNNFILHKQFKYKVVNVLDMPFENIMKYFQSCIAFIKQAINGGGKVLVHW